MSRVERASMLPVSTPSAAAPSAGLASLLRSRMADYVELTKPRIAVLVLITTMIGYLLAHASGPWNLIGLLNTLLGTALAAAGANALNQVVERHTDSLMQRTAARPIPSGRILPADAFWFGISVAAAGLTVLAVFVNALAAGVCAASLVSYVAVYTPLKRHTPWCTAIGAIPGALPPVIGWAAARHALGIEPALLFAIMFVWQIPHFWAIAWMYRQDYGRAGFPMLPVIDADGRRTARQVIALCALLIPLSAAPWWFGFAGHWYLAGALALGIVFLGFGVQFSFDKSYATARRLMLSSIAYLPLVLGLLIIDG